MAKPKIGVLVVQTPDGLIRPGDVGHARTTGGLGFAIRVGEKIKFSNGEFNHSFIVVSTGDGTMGDSVGSPVMVVQATLHGVVHSTLDSLLDHGARIVITSPPVECDRQKIVNFALHQVGDDYSLLAILCITCDILTPASFPAMRRNFTWICSALAAESLRFGGWYWNVGDIYIPTPTQLAVELSADLPPPPPIVFPTSEPLPQAA